jgi:tRNA (guanosine-2'-O-)-methyltransferase
MTHETVDKLLEYFSEYITEARQKKIEDYLPQRTRHVSVVLEDVFQSHNAGAIMRSCDALGVQDVYCIEQRNPFVINNNIARGASKWIDRINYSQEDHSNPTIACIEDLKKKNYTVVATSPHATMKLEDLPIDNKIALLFGTEGEGLTEEAIDAADQLIQIPMYGFTESFNVSVSVALSLYDITTRLRSSSIDWKLSDDEQLFLKLDWYRNSVENADAIERRFFHEHPELEVE